jgi:YD repeat-containing protein
MTVLSSSYALTASYALNGGGGGTEGRTARLEQTVVSDTWTFAHNLGEKYPSIEVFDENDYVIIPTNILAVDENNVTITFSHAITGVASATVGGGLPYISGSYNGRVLAVGAGNPVWKEGIISGSLQVSLDGSGSSMANNYSFHLNAPASSIDSNRYVASVWIKPIAVSTALTPNAYGSNLASIAIDPAWATGQSNSSYNLIPKTTIIDGWQQFEVVFSTKNTNHFLLTLQNGYYYDDIRITPFEANSKAFVYDPFTWKLMSSLDENNFATFYEYDAEGNLIRSKKETEKGIVTLSETRSTHKKN